MSNPTRLFSTSVHYLESLSTDVRSYISETNTEPIQRLGFFCVSKSYFWAKKMAQNAYSKRMLAWTWTLLWLLCGVIIINGTTCRLSVSFGEGSMCGILSFVFVLVILNHGIDGRLHNNEIFSSRTINNKHTHKQFKTEFTDKINPTRGRVTQASLTSLLSSKRSPDCRIAFLFA